MMGRKHVAPTIIFIGLCSLIGFVKWKKRAQEDHYKLKNISNETEDSKTKPLDPLVADPVNGDSPQPVFKFVLTGGPCAGKTTCLSKLSESLRNFGFSVYTIPEAATILFSNGISFSDLEPEYQSYAFQWSLVSLQIALEEEFERMARATNRPSVLICDRGLMDGAAYISPFWWNRILEGKGLSTVHIREGRYDAIFHLVTAALGAEKFYTTANNEARSESPEQAIEQDYKTQACWLGHPHHYVFDNSTDFQGKLKRVLDRASAVVGLPFTSLTGKTKKFLLEEAPTMENFPVTYQEFEVEKIYLRSLLDDVAPAKFGSPSKLYRSFSKDTKSTGSYAVEYSFVRKRVQNGLSVYALTIVRGREGGKRSEVKRMITEREYNSLVTLDADPDRHQLRQRRFSFLWKSQSFQIHMFSSPVNGVAVLHCQAETEDIIIPPFLKVKESLENESDYSGWQVSLKNHLRSLDEHDKSDSFAV